MALITLKLLLIALSGNIDGTDFQHGQNQFELMVVDRPALQTHLIDSDPLQIWTSAQFAGSGLNQRIYWSSELPPKGVDAQHYSGDENQPPTIRVHPIYQSGPTQGQRKPFHDIWAEVVFELYNITHKSQLQNAQEQALSGEISLRGWLEAVTRIEHQALVQTGTFYRTYWRQWISKRGLSTYSLRWTQIQQVPQNYAHWISTYRNLDSYPYADYIQYYREQIAPNISNGLNIPIGNPFDTSLIPNIVIQDQ